MHKVHSNSFSIYPKLQPNHRGQATRQTRTERAWQTKSVLHSSNAVQKLGSVVLNVVCLSGWTVGGGRLTPCRADGTVEICPNSSELEFSNSWSVFSTLSLTPLLAYTVCSMILANNYGTGFCLQLTERCRTSMFRHSWHVCGNTG